MTQINYFMIRKKGLDSCKNYKIILEEYLTIQHMNLILDVHLTRRLGKHGLNS